MGQLVFQATLGGQVALSGPNTASSYTLNLPTVNGNVVSTGDTATVTNTMLATNVYTAPGTIGSGTANTGAFTTLTASTSVLSPIHGSASGSLSLQSAGTTAVTIDTSQNVGIGLTNPTQQLQTTKQTLFDSGGNGVANNVGVGVGSSNTGLFWLTGNALGVSTNGSERMRIDSSGNVGIGVTPSAWQVNNKGLDTGFGYASLSGNNSAGTCDLAFNAYNSSSTALAGWKYKTSNPSTLYQQLNGAHSWQVAPSGTAGNTITFTQAMTLDSSGNLYVGQTSSILQNSNSLFYGATAANTGYLILNHASGSNAGNSFAIFGYNASAIGSITQSGTTAVLYNVTSDYRLKNDVAPIQNALAIVEALNPVNFTWIDGRPDDGFLAHELQTVIPNCVTGEKDAVETVDDLDVDGKVIGTKEVPKYQQIDSSGVIPFLVKAIQEQQALITSLTTRIETLEIAQPKTTTS